MMHGNRLYPNSAQSGVSHAASAVSPQRPPTWYPRTLSCCAKKPSKMEESDYVSREDRAVSDILEGFVPEDETQVEDEAVFEGEQVMDSPVVEEEEESKAEASPVPERMTAAQIYESQLWDPETARAIRPLSEDERPIWMREDGSLDPLAMHDHIQRKYQHREDMSPYTSGGTALKCGDEVQIVYKVWEKVIEPVNNKWRVGHFRERVARWQGVICKMEGRTEETTRIHVKAFYARVPINKIFVVHHHNIKSITVVGFEPDYEEKWNDMSNRKYSSLVVR